MHTHLAAVRRPILLLTSMIDTADDISLCLAVFEKICEMVCLTLKVTVKNIVNLESISMALRLYGFTSLWLFGISYPP